MKASERADRNAKALQLFVAGATYQQIADAIGLRSKSAAHHAVTTELERSSQRRELLADEAFSIHLERLEALFKGHYSQAIRGDVKSAEVCRRVLQQEGRLLGLTPPDGLGAAVPTTPATPPPADDLEGDELNEFRKRRTAGA